MEYLKDEINAIKNLLLGKYGVREPVPSEEVDRLIEAVEQLNTYPKRSPKEKKRIKFIITSQFNMKLTHGGTVLANPDVMRWFDAAKTDIDWHYWDAYKQFLQDDEHRGLNVIDDNEKIIDSILDLSGNPQEEGRWARKGLVMGNVQSGKTQNYLGLINKSMDAGYKVIIVLGGGMNDLRKQTQERVDEGVYGKKSQHIIETNSERQGPYGVGNYRTKNVATATSTLSDFNITIARSLGISFENLKDPIIFTIKKHHKILANLHDWIVENHSLDLEEGTKLDLPLLLIDDEADFASINTKKQKKEITSTNGGIRKILGLFNRSSYVAYTATPFANIFIDPDSTDEMFGDDLFPKDFMIRAPTPANYLGQNFYFDNQDLEKIEPVVIIEDNEDMIPLSHNSLHSIHALAPSLKDAVRAFVISCSLRDSREHVKEHKTMMINITHLNILQMQLLPLVEDYLKELKNSIDNIMGFSTAEQLENSSIKEFLETFNRAFDVQETFEVVLGHIRKSIHKIKTLAINHQTKQVLDYSVHKKNGLSVIVIGGIKLSRGLTLSGLSVSYFTRNSKAYDTLMQMCRWFGYRDGYEDLCKVYLPDVSNAWYSFISEAISELYDELDDMFRLQKTPRDFGLKVREHPGSLVVSARTKMDTAQNSVISIDMWGSQARRFRYFADNKINLENLHSTEAFYEDLSKNNEEKILKDSNSMLFENVSYKNVIRYLQSMQLKEDDIGDSALYNHLKTMKEKNFPEFKVLFKSLKNPSKTPAWSEFKPEIKVLETYNFCGNHINLQNRNYKTDGQILSFPGQQAGTGTDEKFFISDESYKTIIENNPGAQNNSFVRSPERDFPTLIVYMFSIAVVHPYSRQQWAKEKDHLSVDIPFDAPTIGLKLQFPILENNRNLTPMQMKEINTKTKVAYQTNSVFRKLLLPIHVEEDWEE